MDEYWKKIIQKANESKAPLFDAMTLTVAWNMLQRVSEKPRMFEVLEAAFVPTSMDIITNDDDLRKLIPHLPSVEEVKRQGEGPAKLEACHAVAFEATLDNESRDRRIVLIQSAIWYVIRHQVNQT